MHALHNKRARQTEMDGKCRFGTAGFCRSGSVHAAQYVTNTMRVCTKDAVNVAYDATVPVQPRWSSPANMFSGEEFCAPSEKDVPWTMDDSNIADPGMFSAGNAPMWRGSNWDDNAKYPDANRFREVNNTSPGLRSEQRWDASCFKSENMQDVISCSQDSDCVPLPNTGIRLQCVRGICVLHRQDTGTCYSHADCESSSSDGGKLCAGDGRCAHSVLQVENRLNSDIDFEVFAEDCSSSDPSRFPTVTYDTYGASPWEKVPDVLGMYGMCSYRYTICFPFYSMLMSEEK